jgi:hypothetical protein
MAKVSGGKGKKEYGRRVKSSGGGGKARGKRRVWGQAPGQTRSAVQTRFEEPRPGPVYGEGAYPVGRPLYNHE